MNIDSRDSLSPTLINDLATSAQSFVDEARSLILKRRAEGFKSKHKPDGSIVTDVDLETEKLYRQLIEERFPEHNIIGEEFGETQRDSAFTWILDPIDGTSDFAKLEDNFGSIVGLFYDGRPLVGIIDHPALGVRATAAWRNGCVFAGKRASFGTNRPEHPRVSLSQRVNFQRVIDHGHVYDALLQRYPQAQLLTSCHSHTLADCGGVDVAFVCKYCMWDIAATQILVEEAGGTFLALPTFRGPSVIYHSAIFGQKDLVAEVAAAFE